MTGPWLTVSTGVDMAQNGQAGTQRAEQVPATSTPISRSTR